MTMRHRQWPRLFVLGMVGLGSWVTAITLPVGAQKQITMAVDASGDAIVNWILTVLYDLKAWGMPSANQVMASCIYRSCVSTTGKTSGRK